MPWQLRQAENPGRTHSTSSTKESSTDNWFLSFESLQSLHNVTTYLKTEPKIGSENTSHRSNLNEKEIIIRTPSKILSEMEKIFQVALNDWLKSISTEVEYIEIPPGFLVCFTPGVQGQFPGTRAAGVRSLWHDCAVSVSSKRNFCSVSAASALTLINKGNPTPSLHCTKYA